MQPLPQLLMIHENLDKLPELTLPEGFTILDHNVVEDTTWERMIEESFSQKFSFQDFIVNGDDYAPEHVLYVAKDGEPIATITAIENHLYPGHGWFRMVATLPKSRGLGAGRIAVHAALLSLRKRGYKSVMLSTDDNRLPALHLYLSMGFKPYCNHESHQARWETVFQNLKR